MMIETNVKKIEWIWSFILCDDKSEVWLYLCLIMSLLNDILIANLFHYKLPLEYGIVPMLLILHSRLHFMQ